MDTKIKEQPLCIKPTEEMPGTTRERPVSRDKKPSTVGLWTAFCKCGARMDFRGKREKAVAHFQRQGWQEEVKTRNPVCPECFEVMKKAAEEAAKIEEQQSADIAFAEHPAKKE